MASTRPYPVIVVVEDDDGAYQSIERQLTEATGVNPKRFRTVADLEAWSTSPSALRRGAEVAIVDLRLPDGYGWDVVAALQQLSPPCAAIVWSAWADFPLARIPPHVESGVMAVVSKNHDATTLIGLVRSHLLAHEFALPPWPRPEPSTVVAERRLRRLASVLNDAKSVIVPAMAAGGLLVGAIIHFWPR